MIQPGEWNVLQPALFIGVPWNPSAASRFRSGASPRKYGGHKDSYPSTPDLDPAPMPDALFLDLPNTRNERRNSGVVRRWGWPWLNGFAADILRQRLRLRQPASNFRPGAGDGSRSASSGTDSTSFDREPVKVKDEKW